MPFDRYVSLVRHNVSISHDESIPDDKASACALTLGVILPGKEVVRPGARHDTTTDTQQDLVCNWCCRVLQMHWYVYTSIAVVVSSLQAESCDLQLPAPTAGCRQFTW